MNLGNINLDSISLDNINVNNLLWININKFGDKIYEVWINYLPRVIWALIFIYIWFKIINYIDKIIWRILKKEKINLMLQNFILSLCSISLKILILIIAAWILGVQTSSIVAILAAAWFAIGMALSWTLQNFAWWFIILFLKPFKIWDYIEVGWFIWTIKKINIFNTYLSTPDKKIIIIPNSDISNWALINYSYEPRRRIDLIIWVSYKENIDKVKSTLEEIAFADDNIIKEEWIVVWLHDFWESSVNFAFRFYVDTENYLKTRFDILEQVKKTFDKKKISFPFPQRDVHMYNEKPQI